MEEYTPNQSLRHDERLTPYTDMLNLLSAHIHNNNKEKGFWDEERNVGEMLMLIVSELGEAIEAHRKDHFSKLSESERTSMNKEFDKKLFEDRIKNSFEDELADTFIRLLDLAGGLGVDLGWHVKQKITYNTSRARKHGKTY